MSLESIRQVLDRMTREDLQNLLVLLRGEYELTIHPMEREWGTTAEAILEAIYSAPDLTQRGVRGILAEATFRTTVVPTQLREWTSIPLVGDLSYDLLLRSTGGVSIKVQVKNQRREAGRPKIDRKLTLDIGSSVYVVETQRTRNGRKSASGDVTQATRPYHFGEFDVLAVCMHASTSIWSDFIYCPTLSLPARNNDPSLLKVMQPIFPDGMRGWTRDFDIAAAQACRNLE